MHDFIHEFVHDSIHLIPFLFISFLLIEYLHHKQENFIHHSLHRFQSLMPLICALISLIPQCGITIIACNLFANRMISFGSLVASFIACSDEGFLLLLSEGTYLSEASFLLIIKLIIAVIIGYLVDFILSKRHTYSIQQDHEIICGCHHHDHNIFVSAMYSTAKIFMYIFIFNVIITLIMHSPLQDSITSILSSNSLLQPLFISFIGLIPNCAISLLINELYINQIIGFTGLLSGSIVCCGLGLLVLFKMDQRKYYWILLLLILVFCAILSGYIFMIL